MLTESLEIFVYCILPLLILAISLPTNMFGLMVLRNKRKLKSMGPLFMYRLMFAFDGVFACGILIYFMSKCFQLTLYLVSDLACKLVSYYGYASRNIPPLILVYISLDRFVSIKYFKKRFLLKKKTPQYLFISLCILFNSLYYTPVFSYYKLIIDQSNSTRGCYLFGENSISLIYMDMSFLIFIFFFIFLLSFQMIYTIFASRRAVRTQLAPRNNGNNLKDIRLAITSVLFNSYYVLLYLPVLFYNYLFPGIHDLTFYSVLYLFFTSNFVNFYILFASNSLFRKQVILFFVKSNPKHQTTIQQSRPLQLQSNSRLLHITFSGLQRGTSL